MRFPEFTEEWKKTKIGDITSKVGSGVTPKGGSAVYKTSGHLFIRSQNVGNGCFLLDDVAYIDEATHKKQINTELKDGDVLLNITGASIGRTTVVNKNVEGGNVNQHVCIIRLLEDYSPNYICNYLLSYGGQKQIDSFQAGGNREGLNFEQIRSIKFSIPGFREQSKIASLLSLLEERIATQNKIIEQLQSLIKGIRYIIYTQLDCEWVQLSNLVVKGLITLKRGNVIPKYEYSDEYCYPVYSSSTQNDGLMGYFNTYMFDKSLISWSIDGGGNFFYRNKHKFNVTNVCGYLEADESKFDYRFTSELLIYQHSRMVFDYQTKAHPSVIEAMYYLPILDLEKQQCYSKLFEHIYDKLDRETLLLNKYEEQKKFLLSNMFI